MKPEHIAKVATPGWALSIDYETHRVQPGLLVPPLVLGSVAHWTGATRDPASIEGRLLGKRDAVETMIIALRSGVVIVNLNVAFDLAVAANEAQALGIDLMPDIFAAYRDDRVFDTGIAEALHGIANGHLLKDPRTGADLRDPATGETKVGYRQSVVHDLVTGMADAKVNARWRESYALLEGVPLDQLPEDAATYPVDDTRNALWDALAQVGAFPNVGVHAWTDAGTCARCGTAIGFDSVPACVSVYPRRNLHDLGAQVYAAWALHLGAIWGLRSDRESVAMLESCVAHEREAGLPPFIEAGLVRYKREKGVDRPSVNTAALRRAVAIAYGADSESKHVDCGGTGKVPSAKTGKPVQCLGCNATGLVLEGVEVPRSDPSETHADGQIGTGRDVLIDSGDETLMALAGYKEDDKIPNTYLPWLRGGFDVPLILRPNAVLETGRVSYGDVVQLLPRRVSAKLAQLLKERGSKLVGLRDCIVARPGTAFYSNDFTGGELVTFSEACVLRVGFSDLGEALNAGLDAHAALGATMMGVSYEYMAAALKDKKHPDHKRCKNFRQCAKWGNFGFMGGMGAVKFTLTQRRQGEDTPHPSGPSMVWDGTQFVRGYKGMRLCILVDGAEACGIDKVTMWRDRPTTPVCRHCVQVAERIKDAWMHQWREAPKYLNWHARNVDTYGEVEQLYTKRIRGGTSFNSEANGDFQALLADIAKRAQCQVSYEQYVRQRVVSEGDVPSRFEGEWSPLYGSRSILFAHDELFGEAGLDVAPEVSERVNEIMVEKFRALCPNHKPACKAEPTLMVRWWKSAECTRDEVGRLTCWYPKGWAA